jgi:hypothetical protein
MSAALLFANFQQVAVYALYKINQSYITNRYCENKNKPEKHCNGQCHLGKTLAQTEKENSKDFSFKWNDIEVFAQNNSIIPHIKTVYQTTFTTHHFQFASVLLNGFLSVFSPPPQLRLEII